jgi:hypothetical protein
MKLFYKNTLVAEIQVVRKNPTRRAAPPFRVAVPGGIDFKVPLDCLKTLSAAMKDDEGKGVELEDEGKRRPVVIKQAKPHPDNVYVQVDYAEV